MPAAESKSPPLASRTRAFGQVALANALFTALSFITSPIAAHALKPSGRGELAAVGVPLIWAVTLLTIGLPTYATRAAAGEEREHLGALLGTLAAAALALSIVGIAVGIPLAGVLGHADARVHRLLLIGLFTLPVTLLASIGISVANGLEEWRRLNVMRITPPLLTVIAYGTLYATGSLTVTAAVIVTWVAGIISTWPLIGIVRRHWPLSFDRGILRRALRFGPRAWVGSLAGSANSRLDQLLMVPLVTSRELGLYAVAVNVSALDGFLISALSTVIGPSVARGDRHLIARAVRLTVLVDATFGIAFAVVARWLMPIVFGARFSGALPMTYVLLGASVPGAAVWVLGGALQNAGLPGIPALGELTALVVTVVGLVILLPPLAGLGAAIASGAAYTTNAGIQMWLARRRLGLGFGEMLIARRADVAFLTSRIRAAWAARTGVET